MRYLLVIIFLCLFAGLAFANDDQKLFQEISKLASNGNPEAQYHLGMFYNNGIGTPKDKDKAFEWFEKSASSGDPLGNYKLGCYYSGQGGEKLIADFNKALEFKLKSAIAGYALAQYDVAAIYYKKKDIDNAVLWLEKAASQGYPDAIYSLLAIYSGSSSDHKNPVLAYKYLLIIRRNTGTDRQLEIDEKIKVLEQGMTKSQIEEAQTLSSDWSASQTELTRKAFSGKEEGWRLVRSATENKTSSGPK